MASKPKAVAAAASAEAEPVALIAAPVPAEAAVPAEGTAVAGSRMGPADIRKGMEKAMKTTEELVAFGQGNVDAFIKSSQIWSAGMQDLSKQVVACAQASIDETMSALKALSGAKSIKDAFDLQANFARSAFEKSVTESGKLTDASFKLTEQAMAPIAARVTVAIETFVKAV